MESIEDSGVGRKRLVAAGGLIGAILASSCCIAPLLLLTLGLGGAWMSNLTVLAPYQGYFIAATLAFLGTGYWYVYFKHLRPGLLEGELPPIDFHEIMALIAPRAWMDVSALNDGNPLTQRQRVLMLMKVMDVYELEGAAERFSFFVHGHGHAVPHESRALIYGWLDLYLKPPAVTQTRLLSE